MPLRRPVVSACFALAVALGLPLLTILIARSDPRPVWTTALFAAVPMTWGLAIVARAVGHALTDARTALERQVGRPLADAWPSVSAPSALAQLTVVLSWGTALGFFGLARWLSVDAATPTATNHAIASALAAWVTAGASTLLFVLLAVRGVLADTRWRLTHRRPGPPAAAVAERTSTYDRALQMAAWRHLKREAAYARFRWPL